MGELSRTGRGPRSIARLLDPEEEEEEEEEEDEEEEEPAAEVGEVGITASDTELRAGTLSIAVRGTPTGVHSETGFERLRTVAM